MLVARPVSGGGPFQRCLKLSSGYPNHGHRTFEKHQNAPPISFNWWYLYYVYINYIKSMQWWLHAHHCLRKNAPTTCNIHPKYMTLVKVTTNFPNIHGFGYVWMGLGHIKTTRKLQVGPTGVSWSSRLLLRGISLAGLERGQSWINIIGCP